MSFAVAFPVESVGQVTMDRVLQKTWPWGIDPLWTSWWGGCGELTDSLEQIELYRLVMDQDFVWSPQFPWITAALWRTWCPRALACCHFAIFWKNVCSDALSTSCTCMLSTRKVNHCCIERNLTQMMPKQHKTWQCICMHFHIQRRYEVLKVSWVIHTIWWALDKIYSVTNILSGMYASEQRGSNSTLWQIF